MMALALGCSHRVSSRVSTYVDFGCLDFYFCFSFLVISAQILFLVGFYYFCVFCLFCTDLVFGSMAIVMPGHGGGSVVVLPVQ